MLNAKNLIIALAFFLLIMGVTSLTIIVPAATFNPEPTPGLRPYTASELAGRQIFQRENCYVCHSQFVRFQDEGMGPTSQAGDFAYDRVNLLGTLRNGPDLSFEGGLYADEWHIGHLKSPRSYLPGSYMPSYSYLSDTDVRSLVSYIQSLGTRNTRSWETKDVNIPEKYRNLKSPLGQNAANIGAGRGIFNQNCSACHGFEGRADVPLARVFYPKPAANFHLPRYKDFTDGHWYNKTARGVPGTRMPRWDQTLNSEQIWYVVSYLKSLAADQDLAPKPGREKYYDKKVLQPGDNERDYPGAPKAVKGH
jgi:cytochrome c oxidase cbb3-type subunit II